MAQEGGGFMNEEYYGRHLAFFSVSPSLLVLMGRGVFEVVRNPLPVDARPVFAYFDRERQQYVALLESEQFPEFGPDRKLFEVQPPIIQRIPDLGVAA